MAMQAKRPPMRRRLRQLSSTSPLLAGMTFDGKIVRDAQKGAGSARLLRFTDGSAATVTRADLAELARLRGYLRSLQVYKGAPAASRRVMNRKNVKRQQAMRAARVKRLQAEIGAAPTAMKRSLQAQIRQIQRQPVRSSLLGYSPAVAAGSGRMFGLAKRAGIQFRTIGKGKNRRVVPVGV